MVEHNDRDTARRVARLSVRLERGDRPGTGFWRTRQVYSGRGERMGLAARGHLTDYQALLTRVRGRATYRWNRVSPQRRVLLVVDWRDADTGASSRRLLEVASLIAGVVLHTPSALLRVGVYGARERVEVEEWIGAGSMAAARSRIMACTRLRSDRAAPSGALRRLAAHDPGAFVLIVSPFIELETVRRVEAPSGVGVVLVVPRLGVWRYGPGSASAEAAILSSGELRERLLERFEGTVETLRGSRVSARLVRACGSPLEALEEAFA